MLKQLNNLTLGVEEEYQLINPKTRELTSYITEILEDGSVIFRDEVKPELLQSQIEVGSKVCNNLDELHVDLNRLRKLVKQYANKNNLDIVFTITPSSRNPYFNMLEKRKGKLNIFSKTGLAWNWNLKNKKIYRRQDAPKCFDLTTACYVFKPQYIQRTLNLFSGKTGFVLIPRIRSIDIDNSLDYKIVNLLIKS